MKKIALTQDKYCLVDNNDYGHLNQWKWRFHSQGYAVRTKHISFSKGIQVKAEILMHREIMQPPKGFVIDHINRDKLDNRRSNLKICTQAENRLNNKKYINNKSGFTGVCWDKGKSKWLASLTINGKSKFIGRFNSAIEANRAIENYNV